MYASQALTHIPHTSYPTHAHIRYVHMYIHTQTCHIMHMPAAHPHICIHSHMPPINHTHTHTQSTYTLTDTYLPTYLYSFPGFCHEINELKKGNAHSLRYLYVIYFPPLHTDWALSGVLNLQQRNIASLLHLLFLIT